MNKLSNYTKRLEDFQNILIANKNDSTVFGDGKKLVNNDVFKIENNFLHQFFEWLINFFPFIQNLIELIY